MTSLVSKNEIFKNFPIQIFEKTAHSGNLFIYLLQFFELHFYF